MYGVKIDRVYLAFILLKFPRITRVYPDFHEKFMKRLNRRDLTMPLPPTIGRI
jgi:hypothetical protein